MFAYPPSNAILFYEIAVEGWEASFGLVQS